MRFPTLERRSPNRGTEIRHARLGVVFHHSEREFEATIDWMLRPESAVSYHCLIGPDGTRCTLVPDEEIAWHAGASHFRGRDRCNDFLLGVAFSGDTGRCPLTADQIASALEWLASRWTDRGWDLGWLTDHRQVSPGRKRDLDPGEWRRLRAAIAGRFPLPPQHTP